MKKILIVTDVNIIDDELFLSTDFYRFIDIEKMNKEIVKSKIKGVHDDSLTELVRLVQFVSLRRRFNKDMKLHLINIEEDEEELFQVMIDENNQDFLKLIRTKPEFIL